MMKSRFEKNSQSSNFIKVGRQPGNSILVMGQFINSMPWDEETKIKEWEKFLDILGVPKSEEK